MNPELEAGVCEGDVTEGQGVTIDEEGNEAVDGRVRGCHVASCNKSLDRGLLLEHPLCDFASSRKDADEAKPMRKQALQA